MGASSSFNVPASAESPPTMVIATQASSTLRTKQEVLLPGCMSERMSLDRIIVIRPGNGQGDCIWNFPMPSVSTSRPCERRDPYGADSRFGTGAEAFFHFLRPGVMGPCVRRDDPLRVCAKPCPNQRTAQFS